MLYLKAKYYQDKLYKKQQKDNEIGMECKIENRRRI